MNDSVGKVKAFTVIIIALLIYGGPVYYLAFSCFIAWKAGGISEISLGLSEELGWVVKAVSLLGTLSMFSVGFMKSKFKMDGKLDAEEAKKLNIGIYFTFFTMGFSAFLFSAANDWLSVLGIEPLKAFTQSGWNSTVTVFAIILIPAADYFAGVLSLQYMSDVYPDLVAKDEKDGHGSKLSADAKSMLEKLKTISNKNAQDIKNEYGTKAAIEKELKLIMNASTKEYNSMPGALQTFKTSRDIAKRRLEEAISLFP